MDHSRRILSPACLDRRRDECTHTALSDATDNAAFRDAHSNALRRFADDADGRRAALHDAGGFVCTTIIVGAPCSNARGDESMVRGDVRATPRTRRCG